MSKVLDIAAANLLKIGDKIYRDAKEKFEVLSISGSQVVLLTNNTSMKILRIEDLPKEGWMKVPR